jgi:hypothetical protein
MTTGAWPTLLDVASRQVDGKIVRIAEMLSQSIEFSKDVAYVESNELTSHEFAFRTSIPAGYWRYLNQGVPNSKSTTAKGRVSMGMLEDWSMVDVAVAERSGSPERFRETEDWAFAEGMGQTIEQTFLYGNSTVNPAQPFGLSTFYNTVNTATAPNAANVLNGNGTGSSNASLWLIGHSPRHQYAVFPKGSKAGLDVKDFGIERPAYDSAGNQFVAYSTWFRQQVGWVPEDWRYCVRLCNLDTTSAGLAGTNAFDLFVGMAGMLLQCPTTTASGSGITTVDAPDDPSPGVRFVWYANRTVRFAQDQQMLRDKNVLISLNDYDGKPCMSYRGFPIRVLDRLVNTEAQVT